MNWWDQWVGQGYNVNQLVQERNQQGSQTNLLSDQQFQGLINYIVGGQQDTSMLENIEGDFSTLEPYDEASFASFSDELAQQEQATTSPEQMQFLVDEGIIANLSDNIFGDSGQFNFGGMFDFGNMDFNIGDIDLSGNNVLPGATDFNVATEPFSSNPFEADFTNINVAPLPEESNNRNMQQTAEFGDIAETMQQFGGGQFSSTTGFDWSSVPDTVLENYQNMLQSGASTTAINNYLSSMGVGYQGVRELSDFQGGGGIGGIGAKELFYPGQETGFAGVGEGIKQQGAPMQSTLDQLLKKPGGR